MQIQMNAGTLPFFPLCTLCCTHVSCFLSISGMEAENRSGEKELFSETTEVQNRTEQNSTEQNRTEQKYTTEVMLNVERDSFLLFISIKGR